MSLYLFQIVRISAIKLLMSHCWLLSLVSNLWYGTISNCQDFVRWDLRAVLDHTRESSGTKIIMLPSWLLRQLLIAASCILLHNFKPGFLSPRVVFLHRKKRTKSHCKPLQKSVPFSWSHSMWAFEFLASCFWGKTVNGESGQFSSLGVD